MYFRPELNFYAIQPWTNVKIPQKVNAALEEVTSIDVFSVLCLVGYLLIHIFYPLENEEKSKS